MFFRLHRSIVPHSKRPIDPQTHGYTSERQNWLEADTWHIQKINNNTSTIGYLDKIGVDPNGNRICISDAENKYDRFPEDTKLRLRELMMRIWTTQHGKTPGDLRSILVQNTVDEDIQKVREEVYTIMEESDKSKTVTIRADGSKKEKYAYYILIYRFAFGHWVRNMLEYKGLKGKKIKEFVLARLPHQSLQFDIIIDWII